MRFRDGFVLLDEWGNDRVETNEAGPAFGAGPAHEFRGLVKFETSALLDDSVRTSSFRLFLASSTQNFVFLSADETLPMSSDATFEAR